MKRLFLFGMILILLTFTACRNQANLSEALSSVDSSSEKVQEADFGLPGYLSELTDWEKVLDMECILSRDDVNIQIPAAPMDVVGLAECILEMDLVPYEETQNTLDVPHPFTLILQVDGKDERISVTDEKVSVSGRDYYPANPGVLYRYFKEDYRRFLTGDIYMLGEQMSFTAAEVEEVRLDEYENYSDGITKVVTTDREEIDKIVGALDHTVARRFESGEEPGIFAGVGGNGFFCTLILRDGSQWRINPRGLATVTSPSGEEDILILSMDHASVFGLLSSNGSVPRLQAYIDGMTPTVYEKAYQIDNQQKNMTHVIPTGMFFDSDPVLPPKETYNCRLEWMDDAGSRVAPDGITATLYQEAQGPMWQADEVRPLQVDGDVLTLPGNAGRHFVVVRAELAGGKWVESVFSYRSSIYPTAFYDISYGNDEGGVVLTRSDLGVGVTGTQNRKYVDFIMGLDLSPSTGEQQSLPVHKPFTMKFSCDNKSYEFIISKEGVLFNGQSYAVGNPQMIEDLYVAFNVEDPNIFERVNYSLRGFLTKDVAYFTDTFPFNPEEIEEFTIVREEPEQRILHDMSSMERQKIMEILGYVVMGNDWQTEDYYFLRRFYLSYKVILKDGTVYEIGEKILKNGEDTGWYTIQSDSPLASQQVEGKDGVVQQRDIPIHGSIGMDDQGNILIE